MAKADIGLIGLGVMGQNLALNMADQGFRVAVYNRTVARTEEFVAANPAQAARLEACDNLRGFVEVIRPPRAAIIMVKAGAAVDQTIADLAPLLDDGDLIVDAGNEHYGETRRREQELAAKGLRFVGMGVSGGEEGARFGPSIMVGGASDAYSRLGPILEAISARVDGEPCAAYLGPDGAGHFVKMVHNGIEYADMAMIAEVYQYLRQALGMAASDIAGVFEGWTAGPLESYLVDITTVILKEQDPETGTAMVDIILDKAGQKGTGVWSSIAALELGVPAPTIMEAVAARSLSAMKTERVAAAGVLPGPSEQGDRGLVDRAESALFTAKLCAYAQGFEVMKAASEAFDWQLDFAAIARIWRGGCIIRAQFLDKVREAFSAEITPTNLLVAPYFCDAAGHGQSALRDLVAASARAGVAVPCLSSALAYYDGYRTADGPANLVQAQRDFFGAHTFERIDRSGSFHHHWPATTRR